MTDGQSDIPLDKIDLKDGTLAFSSLDFLTRKVDEIKDMEEVQREQYLYSFYDKGFQPLFPRYREDDVPNLTQFTDSKKVRLQKRVSSRSLIVAGKSASSEIDEDGDLVEEFDDDLISDDDFASILNNEREVIVGDSLYKFTYDGLYAVKSTDKPILDTYISDNEIEFLVQENENIIRGESLVTPKIKRRVTTEFHMQKVNDCNNDDVLSIPSVNHLTQYFEDDCGSGGSNFGAVLPTDHTATLVAFVKDLEECNTINGFLNSGFGVFGVSKKCYDNFDNEYRTKTKYYKENYLIYNAIGVKVKHQKKGWTNLWRAKRTDEVALMISQASFKYTINIPGFPNMYAPAKLYFFEDKIFNSQGQLQNYSNAIYKPSFPQIPYLSEVVITEFIQDQTGFDLSVEELREQFYTGVWAVAKNIVNSEKGRDPKNVTHILYSPTKVYLTFIDLEQRQLNSKKITNVFDYNFGIGFKFNVNVDAAGTYTTNMNSWADLYGNLSIPSLYDYDEVMMDFVGVSRKGNTWRGSRLVYTEN